MLLISSWNGCLWMPLRCIAVMAERVHVILNAQGHCQYVRSPWPLRLIKCDSQSIRIIKSQVTAAHYVRGTFIDLVQANLELYLEEACDEFEHTSE